MFSGEIERCASQIPFFPLYPVFHCPPPLSLSLRIFSSLSAAHTLVGVCLLSSVADYLFTKPQFSAGNAGGSRRNDDDGRV